VTKKYSFNLSPATIRNVMADLEEMGFLVQPHTSAGRIPTDKAYRFYVDSLKTRALRDRELEQSFTRKFESLGDDVSRLLGEATRALSSMSHYLAFAIPAKPDGTTLNRVQLFSYMGRKIVAVLITNEGIVMNKILDSNMGLTQQELYRISDYLNSEYSGLSINEIRSVLLGQMSKERALYDILITRAMKICEGALSFQECDLIYSGLAELLGLPELSDKINDIARAFEDKQRIVELLDGMASSDDVAVVIGSENPESKMHNLSVVTARFRQGERLLGTVGMIGPTRMDYQRAISMVEIMARFITGTISRH
jgi:heat-inducible transcriptional repressor